MAMIKIRYKGLSDERHMSKKDLGDAGLSMDSGLSWTVKNLWSQIVSDPSDEFLDMLKRDGNFTVEDADAGSEANAIMVADPAKADDTGATVVDDNQAKAVENKAAKK